MSLAPLVAAVLLVSLALAIATVFRSRPAERILERTAELSRRIEILEAIREIRTAIDEDPDQSSDSADDPLWPALAGIEAASGFRIELSDCSSRIDPNTIHPQYLASEQFRFVLEPWVSQQALVDHHASFGYSTDLAVHFEGIIGAEALRSFVSPYSFVNINVAYPESVYAAVVQRTGEASLADEIRTLILSEYTVQERLSEREWLDFLAARTSGGGADTLYPLVSTLPLWNVHYVPEELIRAVASYPFLEEEPPGPALSELLISLRSSGTIDPTSLGALVTSSTENIHHARIIKSFLGTKTWFYSVSIAPVEGPDEPAARGIIGIVPAGESRYRSYLLELEFVSATPESE